MHLLGEKTWRLYYPHSFCSACTSYFLLSTLFLPYLHELEVARWLPLWLVEVADKDSFADDYLKHVYCACFFVICVYNLARLHIDVS